MKTTKTHKNTKASNVKSTKKPAIQQENASSQNSLLKIAQPNASQHQINQLWQKIAQQKQRNQDYIANMDGQLALYYQTIAPAKAQYLLPALVGLIERLIELFERKTIADWQREVMVKWIGDLQEGVMDISPDAGMQLHIKITNTLQKVAKYKLSDAEADALDEQMQTVLSKLVQEMSGSDIKPPEDGWTFDNIAETLQQAAHAQFFEQLEGNLDDDRPDKSSSEPTADQDFNQWLNQLFRRTAKALHPDKQSDESLREHYQGIMAQLSHAKEVSDIVTIIELYRKYIGDDQFNNLTALDEKRLITALTQHLHGLKAEYHQLQNSNQLTDYAVKRLQKCAKNPKQLDKWIAEIKDEANHLDQTRSELKNLTVLKQVLNEIWQEHEAHFLQVQLQQLMEEGAFGFFEE